MIQRGVFKRVSTWNDFARRYPTEDDFDRVWQAGFKRGSKFLDRQQAAALAQRQSRGDGASIEDFNESAESAESWDLGDGYTLVHRGHGGFKFMFGGKAVGSLMMSRGPDSADSDNAFPGRLASVQDVLIYYQGGSLNPKTNPHRGKGLYRRALPILKQLYGGVRSSHSGATSDDAARAWKAVGARAGLTTDDPVKYGGSHYSLEHLTANKVDQLVDQLLDEVKAPRRQCEPAHLQRRAP